jgi:hypothetical protein
MQKVDFVWSCWGIVDLSGNSREKVVQVGKNMPFAREVFIRVGRGAGGR